MTWQVSLALRGDLQKFMDAEVKAGKSAVTTIIRSRATNLRNNLRRQLIKAKLGARLGKTIKSNIYPLKGTSLNTAGVVVSKATYKRRRGIADLIDVFDKGALRVGGKGTPWIPIPNQAVAGRGTGVRGHPFNKSPSDPEFKGQLAFRKTKKASVGMLVLKSDPEKVAFWLIKVARIGKRIDINKAYAKAIRGIDEAVAKQWERNTQKAQQKFDVSI